MKSTVALISLVLLVMPFAAGDAVPIPVLEGLAAEDFLVREKSQQDLFEWAKENPRERVAPLVVLSNDEDPEIRMRSAVVMRQLSDEDYLTDGQGYLGISMLEEKLEAGADGKPGAGIRVSDVLRESPAHSAGVKAGDLIIALDGKPWRNEGAMEDFMATVAQKKPLVNVVLTIRRDAEGPPIDVTVKLGKRPIEDLRFARESIQSLDKKAKDKHFREWMQRHKPEGQ